MDKTTSSTTTTTSERETHDFMNVDSFSQLPFIRPAPLVIREKPGIRLFGIEFAGGNNNSNTSIVVSADESESNETTTTATPTTNNLNSFDLDPASKDEDTVVVTTTTADASNGGESSRRFECHYCCRNFPTSQALGGHQNAHKRERQHAKRAHLQSTMVHGGSTFSDAHHVYNLMNYRFGSTPTPPPMPYPTWNTNTTTTTNAAARFYSTTPTPSFSQHHQQQPINGSPLAFWRIPTNNNSNPSFSSHERSSLPPLFAAEEVTTTNVRASQVVVGVSAPTTTMQNHRYVYDSKRDHVSLDLHL